MKYNKNPFFSIELKVNREFVFGVTSDCYKEGANDQLFNLSFNDSNVKNIVFYCEIHDNRLSLFAKIDDSYPRWFCYIYLNQEARIDVTFENIIYDAKTSKNKSDVFIKVFRSNHIVGETCIPLVFKSIKKLELQRLYEMDLPWKRNVNINVIECNFDKLNINNMLLIIKAFLTNSISFIWNKVIGSKQIVTVIIILCLIGLVVQRADYGTVVSERDQLTTKLLITEKKLDSIRILVLAKELALNDQLSAVTRQLATDNLSTYEARYKLDSIVRSQSNNDTISYAERLRTVQEFIKLNSNKRK